MRDQIVVLSRTRGVTHFITGMARTYAAEIVILDLKSKYPHITLVILVNTERSNGLWLHGNGIIIS